ncbi:MAG: hypothetical protein K8U03_16445 [Planctomycetia bacterium]|nr:hypothetical protein [Planctomycetia bacterium]
MTFDLYGKHMIYGLVALHPDGRQELVSCHNYRRQAENRPKALARDEEYADCKFFIIRRSVNFTIPPKHLRHEVSPNVYVSSRLVLREEAERFGLSKHPTDD